MHQSSKNKKVLIIAYFIPPLGGGGVQRTVKFVKYLQSFGYEPTVLTVKKGKHSVADTSFDNDLPQNLRVIRTNFIGLFAPKKKPSPKDSSANTTAKQQKPNIMKKFLREAFHFVEKFFFIPDIQMLWRPFACRAALRMLRKEPFDVIYSTSSPFTDHLIARDIHRMTGVPWVADFRDHWTLAPSYKPTTFIHKIIDQYYETSILREADGVIFNTETNKANVAQAFKFLPQNSAVIYNGFDPSDFGNYAYEKSDFIDGYYIGSYYGKNYSSREIIPALDRAIRKNPKIRLTFIGDIDSYSQDIIRSSEFFGTNIFLKDYVPHSEITQYTQRAAFLLVTLPNMPGVECWVPQKLYENIGSGRPTFALAPEDGEVAKILTKVHGGLAVSQKKSPEEIANALLGFIQTLENNNFSSSTDTVALKYFERKQQTEQLANFLNDVTHEA